MRRLIALIVLFVFGSVAYADYEMSDSEKERYLKWAGKSSGADFALAVAPNGCYDVASGGTASGGMYAVRKKALAQCKKKCKTSACRVMDVNGTSAFIKQRGSSSSSSTASSSKNLIWCVTSSSYNNKYVHQVTRAGCASMAGKAFVTQSLAEAEHKRLKGTTTASGPDYVWCATASSVFLIKESECRYKGGKSYATYSLAQAEHQRLKAVATASSNQTSQETTVQTGSTENIFWQSIKDSNDADMYREYLRQFPSGVYAGLAKLKIKKLDGDTQVVNASIPNLDYGDYYALVIGNNEYPGLSNLRSAVGDARAVSNVLEVNYGFKVDHLENATRSQILKSIGKLRANVTRKDNVLIYYAGHGHLDQAADEGYWLPIDADRSDQSNWIATDRIVSQVKAMQAKHVMVVADSCFSGTITRAIKIEQRTPEWLSEIVKKKARTALTSGGLEPVMDTGSGNHSAFAYAFISLLEENDGVLDASQLFSKLRPKVMVNSTQTPQYGKIHMAGDDGGDFLFVRR